LGGNIETFDSTLHLQIVGTGILSGFTSALDVPAAVEIHTGPVIPGQPLQDFDTEIVSLVGAAVPDLDFDSLTIIAGVNEDPSLGSPGHTTLTMQGGSFEVESFFDVGYEISFVGAPGGALDGLSCTTTGLKKMETPPWPEEVPIGLNRALLVLAMLIGGGVVLLHRRGQAS
jgi:hypothetical protein